MKDVPLILCKEKTAYEIDNMIEKVYRQPAAYAIFWRFLADIPIVLNGSTNALQMD